jgi:vitamin B12 transporter
MLCRFRIALVALVSCVAGPLQSQDSIAVRLDTVVVSASKSAPADAPLVQAATVITGAELRAAGVQRVADALRLVPGAAVVGTGAIGSVASLFLRGGESRYTKVLIDGVAVNSVGGYFDFSHLTTDNVERIEIVRGATSVVHGADAMTGVVNIITRRGDDAATAEFEARAGTYGTMNIATSASGALERVRYSLAAARHSTDGILPFNNQYRNGTVSAAFGFSPARATTLNLSTRYGTARFHYPTDFQGFVEDSNSFRDQRRLTVGLDAVRRLSSALELRAFAGSNGVTDVTDDVDPPPPWESGTEDIHSRFRSRTERRNAELRASWRLPVPAVLTAGLEYIREAERNVSSEAPAGAALVPISSFAGRRETRVGFAEFSGGGRLEYTLSARADRPSDFGTFTTYRVGLASVVGPVRLRASAGTAFNAPAFSQLLATEWTVASPDLVPERTRSLEAGLDWRAAGDRLRVGFTRFEQRFLDLIQFVSGPPPDFLGSYANLARARADGWELEARAIPLRGLALTASYTWLDARVDRLDPRYEGPLEPGQPLIRRPPRSASATATYFGWDGGSISAAARFVGTRPDLDFRDFPSPLVELPSHVVADVAGTVRLLGRGDAGTLALTLRAENLFGRRYQEVLYYDAPGRTILIGGRAAWSAW